MDGRADETLRKGRMWLEREGEGVGYNKVGWKVCVIWRLSFLFWIRRPLRWTDETLQKGRVYLEKKGNRVTVR